jgi:hypothetical protein
VNPQLPSPFSLAERAIECAQRQMSGLSCQLQDQAIRKAQRRPRAEKIQSIGHGVRILQRQVFVVEQHSNSFNYLSWWSSVHRSKHPSRLRERENGNPRAFRDERRGGSRLSCIVSRKNAQQNVGIKDAYGALSCIVGYRLSIQREFALSAARPGTLPDGYPRM